jgi:hypothetical protein
MGAAALLLASCAEDTEKAPPEAGGSSSCVGSVDIHFGEPVMGDLAVTGQRDFYRFLGKKGQVVMVDIDAQFLDDAEYDPTYIDPVVTLFDAAGVQVAQNDDPIEYSTNDSRLYTILPADGEYCVRVAECWTVLTNPAAMCQGERDKLVTSYDILLEEIVDAPGDSSSVEVEAGDDATSATAIEYGTTTDDFYTFWGTFRDQADIDVWSFTMPTDLDLPAGVRSNGRFHVNMPDGPIGSGSTSPTGRVWVAEAAAPDVVLAEVDARENQSLSPPLKLGTPYLFFVERPVGEPHLNDFYFVRHLPRWGNPVELETGVGANDTPATAEPLKQSNAGLYIEGDLAMGAQDVDHFIVTVPSGKVAKASCGAQRVGSGLRGLKLSLLAMDESLLATDIPESETYSPRVSITPFKDDTEVVLKVKASSQDPMVAGTFYRCGVRFIEP